MSSLITIASIDTGTDELTASAAHGLSTGAAVGVHAGIDVAGDPGTLPTTSPQVTITGTYFVRAVSSTVLKLFGSKANAEADTSEITLSAAGDGTLYLAELSIKERIERQLQATLAAVAGIGDCERFERLGVQLSEGTIAAPQVDAFISVGDETTKDEPEGNPGGTIKLLPVTAYVLLVQDEDDPQNSQALVNRWLATLERGITADPKIMEASPSSVRLAVDLVITGTLQIPIEEGQRELMAGIEFEVEYEHPRNDPFALNW